MRPRTRKQQLALVVLCALIGSAFSLGIATGAQYSLSVDGGIDTPDKTITVEGQSFPVSETVRIEPGEDINVQTQGPTDEFYRVNLLNKQNQVENYENTLKGSESFSFSTDGVPPGSYVVALYGTDGNYKEIQPVVISGYDVDVSVSESVATGAETSLSVDVTPKQNAPQLDTVELVVANDDSTRTVSVTDSSDGTYTGTTTFDSAGEYRVFATARGTDTYDGSKEIIGLSEVQSVSVNSDGQQSTPANSDDESEPTTTPQTTTPSQTTTEAQSSPETTQTASPTSASSNTASATPEEPGTTQTPATTSATSPLTAVQLSLLLFVLIGSVYRLKQR